MGQKISKCTELLKADVIVPADNMSAEIKVACGADLMSDVMAFACTANEMMLTGLVNTQAIRTAEMMDIKQHQCRCRSYFGGMSLRTDYRRR